MPELEPAALRKRLDAGEDLLLLDVREPFEAEIARIEGARLIPLGDVEKALADLAPWRERQVVIHCQTGGRSRQACRTLLANGFTRVDNLRGGIEAWSGEVGGQ